MGCQMGFGCDCPAAPKDGPAAPQALPRHKMTISGCRVSTRHDNDKLSLAAAQQARGKYRLRLCECRGRSSNLLPAPARGPSSGAKSITEVLTGLGHGTP